MASPGPVPAAGGAAGDPGVREGRESPVAVRPGEHRTRPGFCSIRRGW